MHSLLLGMDRFFAALVARPCTRGPSRQEVWSAFGSAARKALASMDGPVSGAQMLRYRT